MKLEHLSDPLTAPVSPRLQPEEVFGPTHPILSLFVLFPLSEMYSSLFAGQVKSLSQGLGIYRHFAYIAP